tara:strand:- start:86 stop:280 length:195 start_codon:yes stop_codon:yes gene_type:complete
MEEDQKTIRGIVFLTTIDDNGEIGEAFLRADIGDVTRPLFLNQWRTGRVARVVEIVWRRNLRVT